MSDESSCGCFTLIIIFLIGYAIGRGEKETIRPDHVIMYPNGKKIEYYNVEQRKQVDTGYYQTESQNQQSGDSLCSIRGIPRDTSKTSSNFQKDTI